MRGLFLIVFILATSNVFAKNAQFEFFNGNKTKIKNPFRLRDPFKRKILSLKAKRGKYSAFLKGNFFSNLPSIDNVPLSGINLSLSLFSITISGKLSFNIPINSFIDLP